MGEFNGRSVRCLWLIPVTSAAIEFRRVHGTEALEERFEATDFNYADPGRVSAV